ncbi:hypothetical protein DL770_002203 [Monosporascus sp. CRB-9-2]|nr:hypothetical protein DL770_002203 [Monosporascus sp. CRB-9-2]
MIMSSHGEICFGIETETPLVRTGNDDRDSIANGLLEELRNVKHLDMTLKKKRRPSEIIFAAINFENAIRSIMPTHWKARRFFESDMKESQTTRAGQFCIIMMQVWKNIREKESIEDLHDLACHGKDAYRRAKELHSKNFKWNLKGINYKTIEFCQIPVGRSVEDAGDWVDFTAAFVRAGIAADTEDLDKAAESDTTAALNALFNLGDFGLTGRPAEEAHLQAFLWPDAVDDKFWERREKSRADLDEFMKGVPVV